MAYQITKQMYRDEWVETFQRSMTYLKDTTTKETMVEGRSAVFSVQGVRPKMTTRGVNGQIPAQMRTDRQVTITLKERHALEVRTGFDIFTASANLREGMQNSGAKAAYREIDDEIIAAAAEGTNEYDSGTKITTPISYGHVVDFLRVLRENEVAKDDMITCLWTPHAWAALLKIEQATSFDYLPERPLMEGKGDAFNWLGARHIQHTGLPGVGTANSKCILYAKAAIGYCIANDKIRTDIGLDGQNDASYARHTIYHGAEVLQQAGILVVNYDDTSSLTS